MMMTADNLKTKFSMKKKMPSNAFRKKRENVREWMKAGQRVKTEK